MAITLSSRTKVSEDLAILLAEPLAKGELAAGDPIASEVELAETYGVSRPVAREAVQMLALAGMLLVQHGKRTTVRPEREWNVLSPSVQAAFERAGRGDELRRQLYEVRLVLESACAGLAAQHASTDERDHVRAIIERTTQLAASSGSLERFLELDRLFHGLLYSLTGNLPLSQIAREVQGYLASSWESSKLTESEMSESARQHEVIGQAILSGDVETAKKAMDHHIRWAATIERVDPEPAGS
ncbi:MAG: FCD domain-containing protein [Propionibacteriales bacterium]|nr:FCD domain-containing protein [Propionibacteriales bacterium]